MSSSGSGRRCETRLAVLLGEGAHQLKDCSLLDLRRLEGADSTRIDSVRACELVFASVRPLSVLTLKNHARLCLEDGDHVGPLDELGILGTFLIRESALVGLVGQLIDTGL